MDVDYVLSQISLSFLSFDLADKALLQQSPIKCNLFIPLSNLCVCVYYPFQLENCAFQCSI